MNMSIISEGREEASIWSIEQQTEPVLNPMAAIEVVIQQEINEESDDDDII